MLDQYFADRPDAFGVPDPSFPTVFNRVAHELADRGYTVTLPKCISCRKPSRQFKLFTPEGRLCSWCSARSHRRLCARCGELGHPVVTRPEGVICRRCYNHDPDLHEICPRCGKASKPHTRLEDGRALCVNCAPRPAVTCRQCGDLAPAKVRTAEGALCKRCYTDEHQRRECGICGQITIIVYKATPEQPSRCRACGPEPVHHCALCGKDRPAKAHWPLGPVCPPCYIRTIRSPALCTRCGQTKVLTGRGEAGRLCSPCAGGAMDYVCANCAQPGPRLRAGRCARCAVELVATTCLQREGTAPAWVSGLVAELVGAEPPESTLRWLDRPRVRAALTTLADHRREVTHRDLDALPHRQAAEFVRGLLLQSGALPVRNGHLARVEAWLATTVAELIPEHAKYIRPYGYWNVLRRARRTAGRRPFTTGSATRCRRQIRSAIALLADLTAAGETLETLTQPWLDRWTELHPEHLVYIAGFIGWANSHRLIPRIRIHLRSSPLPVVSIDADDQLRRLHELFDADSVLSADVRAAGALILLYGLPVTRIHCLTSADITQVGGKSFLTINRRPLLLPPVLARMLWALAERPRRGDRDSTSQRYLFPGIRAVQAPISARALTARLNAHGINARAERNTALLTLAADLPGPVLAETLGIHISTAVRWSRLAGRDWSHYLKAHTQKHGAGVIVPRKEP